MNIYLSHRRITYEKQSQFLIYFDMVLLFDISLSSLFPHRNIYFTSSVWTAVTFLCIFQQQLYKDQVDKSEWG